MNSKQYRELTKPSEKSIQTEAIGWLRAHGYYVMRINSGKYSVGEGASKRFIMGAEAGTPDVMAFRHISHTDYLPELLFIEVKRPGKKPTKLQEMKMDELEGYGARCIVIHSIAELEEKI